METRILQPSEWHLLKGTEAERALPFLTPENTQAIVVEDGGRVVGSWLMIRTVHAECLWAHPDYRGSFGVAKRLFRAMKECATRWGTDKVITGSVSSYVTDLIKRFGGKPMPCESFILPVEMKDRQARKDRATGHEFHVQLEALAPEGAHPDDDEHDEMVGRTIRLAVKENRPEEAMEAYNHWAFRAGYVPIRYLGTVDGWMRADIVTAKVEINADYELRLLEEMVCP